MGCLFLPSLEVPKFIKMENISVNEAEVYCSLFNKQIIKTKSTIRDSNTTTSIFHYFNNFSLIQSMIDEIENKNDTVEDVESSLAMLFGFSEEKNVRGIRAVFVDISTNTIGVGTTIIYSKNWATINHDGSDFIMKTILSDRYNK